MNVGIDQHLGISRREERPSTMQDSKAQRVLDYFCVFLHSRTSAAISSAFVSSAKWPAQHLFIMTGASPNTRWLRGCPALDDRGFILTGRDLRLAAKPDQSPSGPLSRPPQLLENNLPGVFAVGDVRAGSVKRVASAVGEGAIPCAWCIELSRSSTSSANVALAYTKVLPILTSNCFHSHFRR